MEYITKPFLKWAGGKRQIMSEIKKNMPDNFNRYYEPFVGGGAVFFALNPKKITINDYNKELINVYRIFKNESELKKLVKLLEKYEKNHDEEQFYKIRSLDRNMESYLKISDVKKAARTIYLNKSCFNGLYRVNSKNEFNVPFNKKDKVKTFEYENFENIYKYFNDVDIEIMCGDFKEVTKNAKKGDFIYFDPPYDSNKTSFTSYTEKGFSIDDQKRLFEEYKRY